MSDHSHCMLFYDGASQFRAVLTSTIQDSGFDPASYVVITASGPHPVTPGNSAQKLADVHVSLPRLLGSKTRRSNAISHLIGLNLRRLSLCRLGAKFSERLLRRRCHVPCVLSSIKALSVTISNWFSVDNLLAPNVQTLFVYCAVSRRSHKRSACNLSSSIGRKAVLSAGVTITIHQLAW